MKKDFNFYSVIIGTELLNGRRNDAHFSFLNQELLKRNWMHKASFVIEDDVKLMENIFNLIKSDPDSVMFCFGGIGATPDDYTRKIAAKVFTNNKMEYNKISKELIINQFGQDTYPHRVEMSYLPINAKLLKNVVNNVPGFYLENRFFFTPGFPSMSQSMVKEALNKHYKNNDCTKIRSTLTASCSENDFIDLMKQLPAEIELSSLPKIIENNRYVVLSLSSNNKELVNKYFELFINFCKTNKIEYTLEDKE